MQTTTPCEVRPDPTGESIPGTIGLDLYLSVIGAERGTLRSPRLPRMRPDLSPLLASFALAHPDRAISEVTALEFAQWFATNKGK